MLLIRAKFKHWSRLRHLLRDGRTLCGKVPTESVPVNMEFDGVNCSSCYWNNRALAEPFIYPPKKRL